MRVRTVALIAAAVWAPLILDADAATKIRRDVQRPASECLSKSQILGKLRREGYDPTKHRARSGQILFFDEADALFGKRTGVRDSHDRYAGRDTRRSMKRQYGGAYYVTAVRHKKQVRLTVDKCTGKVLSVALADDLAKAIKCLSKSAVHQKLKSGGYGYLKLENVHGPFNTPKGKAYRAQTLVKEGPRWCQAKLLVNCYNANVIDYDTLEETCIY